MGMSIYSFSITLFSFGVALIAALVLSKRKDQIGLRFLAFSLSVVSWGVPEALWMSGIYEMPTVLTIMRISNIAAVFIPITWFHFVSEFLSKRESRYFYIVNYVIAIVIALFGFTPLFIPHTQSILNYKYYTAPGPLYHVFTISFVSLVLYGFYNLARAYRIAHGQKKEQLKYFLIATFIGFTAGGSSLFLVYQIPFPLFLTVFMPLYPFFMGIALIRHGLFNAEEAMDAFRRDKLAAIGTLATSINHEIRNPLYIIQGVAQSFLANFEEGVFQDKEAALEKSLEVLKKTMDQSLRAMDIMKRFAMFAKQDVKQRPEIEKVSLSQALANILPLINHELELEKIMMIQDIPKNLSLVHIDRRHLEEILFNLILNACQAMKSQKISGEICISAVQQRKYISIRIKDNGLGIPLEKLKQIFEPFYTTKNEGTGLGLYITKQLVEKNCGRIFVTSRHEEGTEFLLRFLKATEKVPAFSGEKKTRLRADIY